MTWTVDSVPPCGSPRITLEYNCATGNPEHWTTVKKSLGNYEPYEPESQFDYLEYLVADNFVTMLIDDKEVFSMSWCVFQGDDAPEDDPMPSEADVYDAFIESLKPVAS